MPHESEQLARFLYRPIVFREPQRVVHPPSWLEHIPFAFWIVDVVRPTTVVELGTQSGNSYASFAQAIQILELGSAAYCVDTWKGDTQAGFYDEAVFTEWAEYHQGHFAAFSRLIRSTFEEAVRPLSARAASTFSTLTDATRMKRPWPTSRNGGRSSAPGVWSSFMTSTCASATSASGGSGSS